MQVSSRWWLLAACCWLFGCLACDACLAASNESSPAASFDCARAVGIDTDIICSDPLLRHADYELGRLYRAALAEAETQARIDALKADERTWILHRNSECNVTKSLKLNAEDRPEYVDCFLAAYDERMDDLTRIKAESQRDPNSISNPIRKSSFGDNIGTIAIPGGALVDTGALVAEKNPPSVLVFSADGSLAILGTKGDTSGLHVWLWKSNPMSAQTASQTLTQVMPSGPTIAADASLCAAGKTLVVLPAQQTQSALLATQGRVQSLALNALPAEVRRACGVAVERHQIGTPDGSVALDLGPRTSSLASPTRFVSLIDAQGTHALNPPIRIDRRFALMGQFNPSSGQFVVSPGARPAALQTIADRTWAKTNCGKFWLVDAATRRVASGCIPFGAYADETGDATVVPLPSRAGLFFAVPERGLYRVVDDTAKQVVAAPVDQARLGPDGCSLAFIGSASKTAQGRQVMVLNVCKLTP